MESNSFYLNESKNVIFKDNVVIKKYSIDVEDEFLKSKHIYELSKKHSFVFPKPLNLEGSNSVVFENIKAEKSIREEYIHFMKGRIDEAEVVDLFERIGNILAFLHNNIKLDSESYWYPSENFIKAMSAYGIDDVDLYTRRLPMTYMHCDYGFSNISFNENNGVKDIVIYDASPNNFITFKTNCMGPVYIDVGNMISCLNGLVPVSNYFSMKWSKLPSLKDAFLRGYMEASNYEVDMSWVDKFSYATAHCYFDKKYGASIKQKAAITMLFNSYKKNIKDLV